MFTMPSFFANDPYCDARSCIKPILDGSFLRFITTFPLSREHNNLSALRGNIAVSEIDTQVPVALTTSKAIPATRNIPSSIGAVTRATAGAHKFDYVLADMSPSVGALNESLLIPGDFFIVATAWWAEACLPPGHRFAIMNIVNSLSDCVDSTILNKRLKNHNESCRKHQRRTRTDRQ
jgi:hypothetical protein